MQDTQAQIYTWAKMKESALQPLAYNPLRLSMEIKS